MKSLSKIFAALLCVFVPALGVQAQSAITFADSAVGASANSFMSHDTILGWEFVPLVNVTVLQLGLYNGHFPGDGRPQDGFVVPHTVTIWDQNANALSSIAFAAGDAAPLLGGFRFLPVTPITLYAGQTYVIGASMPTSYDYTQGFSDRSTFDLYGSIDPKIRFVSGRFAYSSNPTAFPDTGIEPFFGFFGPNFIMAVPEPASALVMLLGTGVGFLARRRATRELPTDNY
jgi:hypothetical protein